MHMGGTVGGACSGAHHRGRGAHGVATEAGGRGGR